MRYRPNMDSFGVSAIVEKIDKVLENGKVETRNFIPTLEELPDSSLFDLETMVKAGVPLQKTSTKVVGTDLGLVADAFNDFNPKNGENNNEQ